jgi:hypothetical protein
MINIKEVSRRGEHRLRQSAEENIRTQLGENNRRLEELHNSYTSPNIIDIIKLIRMIWADHVAPLPAV